jgi:hypothetical protein
MRVALRRRAGEPQRWPLGIGAGMVYPPGYRLVHDLPNKPLTGDSICKILKTKEMICKIFKTLELWFLWSFEEDTSLRLVDSVST